MFTWQRGLFIIGAVSLAVAVVAIFKRKTNKDTKPLMSETTDKPEALPLCIFCSNESGSEEHIWPAWIHRYKKFGPLKTAMINDSTKIRNGNQMFYTDQERTAMRESRAIPPQTRIWLGQIDEDWHIGIHGTDFTITNGNKLRLGEGAVTTIYMGRFVVQVVTEHIKPEYAHPDFPRVNPKSRDWEKMLIEAWPTLSKKLLWPPPTPFTNGGPNGIAYLMERWRIGTRVTPGSI